jgi:hypothetical protein
LNVADRVVFLRPDAERIARAVRTVEAGNRDESPLTFRKVGAEGGGKAFRVCTFTGSWNINSRKTLTFQGVTTTPNTIVATNQLFTIGDACEEQVCYIGKVSSSEPAAATAAWHLLNVQHHETAVIVNVTLTTAALEFTRRLMWVPYPGETATLSIPLVTDTSCSP